MASYLILDCHYLLYRCHYAMNNLEYEGEKTGATFGFFRDLIQLQDLFDPDRIVFCFDRGKGKRKELLPSYKSTRRKDWTQEDIDRNEELQKQIRILRTKLLRKIGFRNILSQSGYEADDIIASITRNSIGADDDAVIVSSDGDLLQLLDHNVILYNPTKKRVMNAKKFRKQWGIYPPQWADVKAMAGCISDDIKGIPRIGEKTAARWFAGTIQTGTTTYEKICQNIHIYNKNISLTRLPFKGTETFTLEDHIINKNKWTEIMDSMGFSTIRNQRKRN